MTEKIVFLFTQVAPKEYDVYLFDFLTNKLYVYVY